MTSAAARGRGGTRLGEKDAGLADPLRLLRGRPTGRDPRHLWDERGAGGCRGHGWRGGREPRGGCRCASGKQWAFGMSAGCARSQPRGGRGSRRGQDPHSSPPTGGSAGRGAVEPQRALFPPASLPPPPAPPAHSWPWSPPSATLNPDGKHPCPLWRPSPAPELSLAVAPARSRGDQR